MGLGESLFGSKVKVPEFRPIDIEGLVSRTTRQSLKAFDEAAKLATQTAAAQTQNVLAGLRSFAPRLDTELRLGGEAREDLLRGRLPSESVRFLRDQANARAFGGGFGGTPFAASAELQTLRGQSLNAILAGLQESRAQIGLGASLTAPPLSAASMFLSPGQRFEMEQSERNSQFERDLLKAQVKAQPDPVAGGIFDTTMAVLGALAGGFGVPGGAQAGQAVGAARRSQGGLPQNFQAPSGTVSPQRSFSEQMGFAPGDQGAPGTAFSRLFNFGAGAR